MLEDVIIPAFQLYSPSTYLLSKQNTKAPTVLPH